MVLWNYIRGNMMQNLSQTVSEKDAHLTYEEVLIYVEVIAKRLSGESICAIYCQSELFASIALLGCLSAGVTAVPLSARYGTAHAVKILRSCSPTCIITDMCGELGVYYITDSHNTKKKNRAALIMWTSGTTGEPKGSMLSEQGIITNLQDITTYFSMGKEDGILIARPIYHCAVLTGEFLTALIKGARIVFCSEPFNPVSLVHLMKRQHITTFCGTPTLFNMLMHFIKKEEVNLKHIVVSGECMSEEIGHKIRIFFPHANIYHVYGLTEASPRVSYMPPEYFDKAVDCVGRPLASVKIEIRNKKGIPIPQGKKGILWVKGKNIMQGYYHAPKQTKKVLVDGWLCTGDIAEISEKGWLRIHGRSDDLIIRAGMNIFPQEIEKELKKDQRINEVLAYGYEDARGITQIGLIVSGNFHSTDEVRALCKASLPPYQVPMKVELVSKIDQNASGKIIRGKRDAGI